MNIKTEKNLVLYGGGYLGLMFCDALLASGVEPLFILDRDVRKRHMKWAGRISVMDPEEVRPSEWENLFVIVCMMDQGKVYDEIAVDLGRKGCRRINHILELADSKDWAFAFAGQKIVLRANSDLVEDNEPFWRKVYGILEDGLSRNTYEAILSRMLYHDDRSGKIPSLPMRQQYFAYDIYKKTDDEVFVDIGAFDGSVMHTFLSNTDNRFKAYYAYEPDPQNCERIKAPEKVVGRIRVVCKGLSDKDETVYMKNYWNANSVITEGGTIRAECTTLDHLYNEGVRPTFIKIDVEGYERKVLEGGSGLIQKTAPVIACAGYHEEKQFWEIPLLLKSLVPEYKLYVRSYMNLLETCFYAVPPQREAGR